MSLLPTAAMLSGSITREISSLGDIKADAFRKVRRRYSRLLKFTDPAVVIDTARMLVAGKDLRGFAYELVRYHPPSFRLLDRSLLEELGRGMDSWWTVDSFARILAGPAWLEGLIRDSVIEDWTASTDLWWRRAALVSTVALNVRSGGGYGDTERTLHICRLLAADHEDMVVKALSWALRELVFHDPEAVRTFLGDHEMHLAARVKREVRNKLETGLKNP